MGNTQFSYIPSLDGIRALAIILVVLLHAYIPGFAGGYFGVDIFFVLSGYLITRILRGEKERTGRIDLWRFWSRRLRRLYPALLLMLAAYLAIGWAAWPNQPFVMNLKASLVAGLYLSDYAWALNVAPNQLDHTWSLAVEEQFYLVWPIALIGLSRLTKKQAVIALIGLYAVAMAWRIAQSGVRTDIQLHFSFDTHATGLILGCLIGLVNPQVPKWSAILGLAGIALAFFAFPTRDMTTFLIGFPLIEVSAALLILAAPSWLGVAPLAWIGRMSYGWYLWHYPIMVWMLNQGFGWAPVAAIGGGISLAAAAISYYTVERWFRVHPQNLRDDVALAEQPTGLSRNRPSVVP